jgi:Cu(I)-responsive transcriptional regulator
MNIGEAALAAGVTAKMIRNYESLGLIAEASRTDAGYRQYTGRDVTVLRFIRHSRSMGFSIKQIQQLLGLWADTQRESRNVKALARGQIADLDRKMAEMAQMKAALEQIAAACHGDHRADCPILDTLSRDATATVPAPKPVPSPPRADKTRRRDATPPEHGSLMAWMHGLRPAGATGHA